jgi:hypothetical protein
LHILVPHENNLTDFLNKLLHFFFFLEVITYNFSGVATKDISTQISRWFSGAKDRDGGKKERLLNKFHDDKYKKKDI